MIEQDTQDLPIAAIEDYNFIIDETFLINQLKNDIKTYKNIKH